MDTLCVECTVWIECMAKKGRETEILHRTDDEVNKTMTMTWELVLLCLVACIGIHYVKSKRITWQGRSLR
jgi:hypothetical protein